MAQALVKGADNWLRVLGARNTKTGAYLNGVQVRLLALVDEAGNAVSGLALPQSLTYVAGSNGDYEFLLPRTLPFDETKRYVARAEIDGGPGLYTPLEEDLVVRIGGKG